MRSSLIAFLFLTNFGLPAYVYDRQVYYGGHTEMETRLYSLPINGSKKTVQLALMSGFEGRDLGNDPELILVEIYTQANTSRIREISQLVCRKNGHHLLMVRLYKQNDYNLYGWAPFNNFRIFFAGTEKTLRVNCHIERDIYFRMPYSIILAFRDFIRSLIYF